MLDTFRTYTGQTIHILDPQPEDIRFEDIARALSRVQRFGGHCHKTCSVAEHSVLVSRLCRPEHALLGLFHDASEAYVGDVITPLKTNLPEYKALERVWMQQIGLALGLGDALANLPEDVHEADAVALQTERRDLFDDDRVDPEGPEPSGHIVRGLGPDAAYWLFVRRFREITGEFPLRAF